MLKMNSKIPDELINRLTKSLLGILGHDSQQVEEIVISDEESLVDDQDTNGTESNSDLTIISSSEEQVQSDRNDIVNPSILNDSEITKEGEEPTNVDAIDTIEGDDGAATTNEGTSHYEDGNESDVIDLYENDEDLFKKLDGEPMVCNACYPTTIFRKKSLFIIHRIRHYAEDHFICPICQEGFVKLMHCVSHELQAHKEETQLNDQGFASAVSIILAQGKHNPTVAIDVQNNSDGSNTKAEADTVYSDYAVTSTSLYPYSGPPVESYADTYDIHNKYCRPKKCLLSTMARSVKTWRSQYEAYTKEDTDANESLPPVPNRDSKYYRSSSDAHASDSSYTSQGSRQKRKKYRKTAKKGKKPDVKAYCCNICSFTSNLKSEFMEHSRTQHPNFSNDQVLEYFVLPSLGHYSPVRKKKTSFGPPPKKKTRYEISDDSAGESIHDSCSVLSSTPPESVVAATTPDYSTKDGFFSSLGLIRNVSAAK